MWGGNELFCRVHGNLQSDVVTTSHKLLSSVLKKSASVSYTSMSGHYAFKPHKHHQISEIFINFQYLCVGYHRHFNTIVKCLKQWASSESLNRA